MKLKLALLMVVLSLTLFVSPAPKAHAQVTVTCPDGSQVSVTQGAAGAGTEAVCNTACNNRGGSFLGLPTWYKYLERGFEHGRCTVTGPTNASTGQFDWQKASGYIALAVVEAMLQIAALVAVGFIIYGGFNYITSQGDPEKAKNARQRIINALIGLVITLAASGAVRFAGNLLSS